MERSRIGALPQRSRTSADKHGIHPIITGPPGRVKFGHVLAVKLHEFKKGRLYNRAGKLVTRRNQALNSARYEARLAGARDVPKEGKAEKTKALEALQKRRTGLRKPAACLLTPPATSLISNRGVPKPTPREDERWVLG